MANMKYNVHHPSKQNLLKKEKQAQHDYFSSYFKEGFLNLLLVYHYRLYMTYTLAGCFLFK